MDWVMASIVDQLKESGLLDKTLVVITNDHGERTGRRMAAHRAWLGPDPELANTPLIIMDPQKPGTALNYTLGSQIDLLPTRPGPAENLRCRPASFMRAAHFTRPERENHASSI